MKKFLLISFFLASYNIGAFDEFVISDIRVVGLQRVSIGSIFTIIPINVGDRMSQDKVSDIVNALFETEQFNNIEIAKDDGALIILLQERPSISSIELDGNQALIRRSSKRA